MAEDTLLTFCPPAPCERIAVSSISLAGIETFREIPGTALHPIPGFSQYAWHRPFLPCPYYPRLLQARGTDGLTVKHGQSPAGDQSNRLPCTSRSYRPYCELLLNTWFCHLSGHACNPAALVPLVLLHHPPGRVNSLFLLVSGFGNELVPGVSGVIAPQCGFKILVHNF